MGLGQSCDSEYVRPSDCLWTVHPLVSSYGWSHIPLFRGSVPGWPLVPKAFCRVDLGWREQEPAKLSAHGAFTVKSALIYFLFVLCRLSHRF